MVYHGFNILARLPNGDFAAKIGHGILSCDLMDILWNCSIPYMFNRKCVYTGKFQGEIYI